MTCIVGLAPGDGTVWMGSDSFQGRENGDVRTQDMHPKIFIHKQDSYGAHSSMIFGVSGHMRVAQILEYIWSIPECQDNTDPLKWVMRIMIPSLQQELDKKFDLNRLLLGLRGRLFCLCPDWTVIESAHHYDAIGSGEPLAKGSLYTTELCAKMLDPETRIRTALETSERHCVDVRAPFTVLHI